MREDRKRNSIGRSYHSVTFVPFLFLSIIRRIDRIYLNDKDCLLYPLMPVTNLSFDRLFIPLVSFCEF